MTLETNFEEGLARIVKILNGIQRQPVLAAVWGNPNSGKTYLMRQIGVHLNTDLTRVIGYGSTAGAHSFRNIRDSDGLSQRIHLFHCAWMRDNPDELAYKAAFEDEDPNFLAERMLGRKLDLNVAIYDPRFCSKPFGVYDFIISNPNTVRDKSKNGKI